jgi:hypothetical protein
MANDWRIFYSQRAWPDRVQAYGRYPTRNAARAALAALATRWAGAPGGRVDVDGPDDVTLDTRTAFSVRRARRRDALGRLVAGVVVGLAIACHAFAGAAPVAAQDDVPAGWPCAYDAATVDALTPAARAALVDCLDAFGWTHDNDDDDAPAPAGK